MAARRDRFARHRQAVGLTQEALAGLLGVDRSTIVRWESGRATPQPWMRPRLARALRVNAEALDSLLTTGGDPDRPGPPRPLFRIAICGSRAAGCDPTLLDESVRSLAGLVTAHGCQVQHGPLGIGIEVMTYIADHYRPQEFVRAIGLFGHGNVVRRVNYVIVAGGGQGTEEEIRLARSLRVPVLPIPPTGGAARRFHAAAEQDRGLRPWITDEQLTRLNRCSGVEDYVRFIETMLSTTTPELPHG
ncbi:helix-turn-helix domain-containing protein [Streptomyces sp. JH002]|uniref:helix-turn-helix transcriptional regulator n=1 Tax=Streptomyces sp. JH002 TaxID=2763259 RepID=UPI003D801C0A